MIKSKTENPNKPKMKKDKNDRLQFISKQRSVSPMASSNKFFQYDQFYEFEPVPTKLKREVKNK